MALKTTVKVTINNLSDARYCAGMGVDLIAYSADPADPFYLSSENFKEIAEWLSGVSFVAELNNNESLPPDYHADFIQVNHPSSAAKFPEDKIIICNKAETIRTFKNDLISIPNLSFLLIDIDDDKADLIQIIEEFKEFPLLIGFDLTIDEVEDVVKSSAQGIALKGSEEQKPGLKDYDALADILEILEVDAPY